jgi:S1-C subfamily serine protease
MDTEQGPSVPYGAPPPPPPPAWPGWASAGPQPPPPFPGYGAPGQPGGPWGYGPNPQRPARRRRGLILAVAATAFALAAAGVAVASGGSGSSALSPAAVAGKVDPGLVDIMTTLGYQRGAAAGTGMVLTPDGEVLTNNHVIAGATAILARDIGNGRTYTAKVVGYSDSQDVAVLQLEGASGLTTVPIGSSSGLAIGQKVVALGNAEGKGGTPAVATGHITGTGAEVTAEDQGSGSLEHLTGMIRTNADIQPGDSGGPLVNAAGQVIGMDAAASTGSSGQPGTTAAVATTAFAIPISRAISVAEQIEAGTASSTVHIGPTAFLGVGVSSQSGSGASGQNGSGGTGATIAGVVPGTPAAATGLAAGDTILSVGGHTVPSATDLQGVIELYHPGDHVSVSWTDQAGQPHSATVTLTTGPAG